MTKAKAAPVTKSVTTPTILMMIALLAISVSLLPAQAQAVDLTNGDFVAQQCGAQLIDTAHKDSRVMASACVGFLAGTKTRAVRFTMSNDVKFLFQVAGQSNLMMAMNAGATVTIFRLVNVNGEEIAMKAIVNHDGTLRSLSGHFQTNSYIVPVLQQMLTLE